MYKYYFILNQHTRPIECPLILFFPAPKVIIFWIVKILKSILSKVVIITCTLTIIRQRNTTSKKVLKIYKHNPYKSKHIWIAIITIQDLGVVIFNFWWEGEENQNNSVFTRRIIYYYKKSNIIRVGDPIIAIFRD